MWPSRLRNTAKYSPSVSECGRCGGELMAELLTRHREDEVGLLLGHEPRAGLRAVEEALAPQAAVADGDAGLLGGDHVHDHATLEHLGHAALHTGGAGGGVLLSHVDHPATAAPSESR